MELTFVLFVVIVIFDWSAAPLRCRAGAGPGRRLVGSLHSHGRVHAFGIHGGPHLLLHLRGALGFGG